MSRWKAFAIHLACSILALGGVLAALVWIWYPPPLFFASGVQDFATVFVAVDIVIGPLLTLMVYTAGKPGLRRDLGIIAAIQLAAFLYGLNVVRETRPVYLVASEGQIAVVNAHTIYSKDRDQAPAAYRENPWFAPSLVSIPDPKDQLEWGRRMTRSLNSGFGIETMPQYYRAWEAGAPDLLRAARPLSLLRADGISTGKVDAFLTRHDVPLDEAVFVPFRATERSLCAVLDASSGRLLGLLDIKPPPKPSPTATPDQSDQ